MFTLDHIVASSRQLDDACASWERLGFTITPRGFHPFGTMNNLVVFESTFFELLALDDGAAFDQAVETSTIPANLAKLTRTALETRDGLSLLAVTTGDVDGDFRAIRTHGIGVSTPLRFKRPVILPGGRETAADVTVHFLEDAKDRGAPVFVSQQHNREAVWASEWQRHPNGAVQIASVTYTAERPDELVPYLAAIFGEPARMTNGEELQFSAGPSHVVVTTPRRCRERFALVAGDEFPTSPSLEALTIAVRDLTQLGEHLKAHRVLHRRASAHSIQVGRQEAAGTLVEFVEIEGRA